MSAVVGTDLVCQVGFIVKDINATKKKWAEFLGVEEPEAALCGEFEIGRASCRERVCQYV